jgi:hypothetical protein
MALRGHHRWRPTVVHLSTRPLVHPPAVERACMLRVLVGAQAAPASHASSRRALSPIIVRVDKFSPAVDVTARRRRRPACAVQTAVTAQAPRILRAPRVGAETLCANLMPVIDPVPQVCVLSRLARYHGAKPARRQRLLHAPSRLAAPGVHEPGDDAIRTLHLAHPAQQHRDLPDALPAASSMARSPDAARRRAICCSAGTLAAPRQLARSHWYLGRELLEAFGCRHERAPQRLASMAGRDKPPNARQTRSVALQGSATRRPSMYPRRVRRVSLLA